MPVIPFALSERSIPGQTGSPFMPESDPVGAALQKAGAQVEDSAQRLQTVLTAQKFKEDRLRKGLEAEKLAYDFKDQTSLIAEEIKKNPLYDAQWAQDQINTLTSNLQGQNKDPDVWRAAQPSILNESHSLMSAARAHDTQKLVDAGKALTDRKVTEGIRDAAIAATPEERLRIKGGVVEHVAAMVQSGVYKAHEGELIIQHFEPQVADAYFRELGRTNPAKAIDELNDKKSEMTRLLDPVKKQEFLKAFDTKAQGQQDDAAYTHVFEKYELGKPEGNYEAAIREIRNPASDVPAIKILSREQRAGVEAMLRGQEAYNIQEAARIFTEGKKKDLDLIGETYIGTSSVKGDVAKAIRLTRESPFIQGMDKVHIIDAFQKPAPEGKSNSQAYLEGAEKMYDPSLPLEDKKTWLLKNRGNLNISDYKHFTNVGMSQERSNDKSAVKSGIETLKAALITPGLTSQTQKERLDRAIKLYESGTEQYKATLNTPDKIKSFANEILKMADFTNVNPIADMKEDMKKLRGVGLGVTPPTLTQPKYAIGTTATNPKTGQKVTWDGTQWK